MQALVKTAYGAGQMELRDVPVPTTGLDEVLVRVKAAAICGSDVERFTGRLNIYTPPVVLGHEISGVVEKIGDNVDSVEIGARVAIEANAYACGRCLVCREGRENLCPSRKGIGYDVDGGFAEFIKVPADMLIRLPDGVSHEIACLMDLCVAVHAVADRAHVGPESRALITGPGFLGLCLVQLCRLAGVPQITVLGTDRDAARLDLARRLGAAEVLQSADALGRREFSSVFEASGSPQAYQTAIKHVSRGGEIIAVGVLPEDAGIAMREVTLREVSLYGVRAYRFGNCQMAMDLLDDRRVDLEPLLDRVMPLASWRQAFGMLVAGEAVKVVLVPGVDHAESPDRV